MDNTVASASRDILRIKRRKYSHYAYRGLQFLARLGHESTPRNVLLYPAINDSDRLGNLLNRLGWYLPERTLRHDVEVLVPTDLDIEEVRSHTPPEQASYETTHLPLTRVNPAETPEKASAADALLTWDADYRTALTALRNLPKVEIVDPTYYSGFEPYNWGSFMDRLRTDPGDVSALFERLEIQAAAERAYVFATGPSLERAEEFTFEDDAVKVVCNSIVKNEDLLTHIAPDVLVFADPVFHFGPSRYANRFRSDAVRAIREHDCLAVIPERHRSLFAGHFPDVDLVGLESADVDTPIFPRHNDLRVMGTNNVMTWFMLPIASALADEVNIIGADGREEDETYFWDHNEDAQYDEDLMESAVECHTSFFRDEIYSDYYQNHCETLAAFLEYGESQGVTYRTLTDSHVDCLAERTVPETKPMVT